MNIEGFAFMCIIVFATWIYQLTKRDNVDIRNFEQDPYCETSEVAGKKFTRCLKAIEVPPPNEK